MKEGENNDFQTFFEKTPLINPNISKIKGVICGYRVKDIEEPLIQKIRYLDKLIVELAKGKIRYIILHNFGLTNNNISITQ